MVYFFMDMNPTLILYFFSAFTSLEAFLTYTNCFCGSIQSPSIGSLNTHVGYAFRTRSSSYSSGDNGDNFAVISSRCSYSSGSSRCCGRSFNVIYFFVSRSDHIQNMHDAPEHNQDDKYNRHVD